MVVAIDPPPLIILAPVPGLEPGQAVQQTAVLRLHHTGSSRKPPTLPTRHHATALPGTFFSGMSTPSIVVLAPRAGVEPASSDRESEILATRLAGLRRGPCASRLRCRGQNGIRRVAPPAIPRIEDRHVLAVDRGGDPLAVLAASRARAYHLVSVHLHHSRCSSEKQTVFSTFLEASRNPPAPSPRASR